MVTAEKFLRKRPADPQNLTEALPEKPENETSGKVHWQNCT